MPAEDLFLSTFSGLEVPAKDALEVTPDDDEDIAIASRGIYVGGGGDLKVTMLGGEDVTFVGLAGGVTYPLRVSRVWATGTTATDLVALW